VASDRTRFARRRHPEPTTAPADQLDKRLIDVVLATVLLIILAPVMAIIAIGVRLDGGPVFYGHCRIGAGGRAFSCWKFRTMVVDADAVLHRILATDPRAREEWERDWKLKLDPRITPIGRLLRTASLDELPQLFNVLRGEMSLVGPRPIVADEIRRYGSAFHDYVRCRPGITGVWQVSGRTQLDYASRVRLDREYANTRSFVLDCAILARTVRVVIARRGAY
jgi:undecaprenyl-phosphate galactose phosphotransferase